VLFLAGEGLAALPVLTAPELTGAFEQDYYGCAALFDQGMKHKREHLQPLLEQVTVADLVRFLLWLPADEREKVVNLLRAIQDRRWLEVWLEPIIVGDAQE
jgi:hypothetical protein